MPHPLLTPDDIETFQRDGVVLVRGLFADRVDSLRQGIEKNLCHPSPYASENERAGETGRFFDDYCNWTRIREFSDAILNGPAAEVAADLMGSDRVQVFHDHVLVKEPGTSMATPWHQDGPYYFVEGRQTVSFWSPLDPVDEASLRCVAGSHLWEKDVLPTRWVTESAFFPDPDLYRPVPDPEAEGMDIRAWPMAPGDAVAFHFRTLHGARGNTSANRRRAFSVRFVGDDAVYADRPGRTSPPFPGHGMRAGERLREDWFPTIFDRSSG
ncbi:phytanoyl-CoA dioxygenase family protein [Chachezhania sediminis]|uniref:phytanoyl-CoA dioxygenase family protein n=1 Tax=Chachezhania sediminis TaxID=2599291 RepID=UPI00131E7716|nr:phytanoyl-CoA dioxygenase family protein [Chachezhania sediminis]